MFITFESPIPLIGNYSNAQKDLCIRLFTAKLFIKALKVILRHKKRKIVKLWEIYMNIIQRFNMVQMNVYYLYQKLFFLLLQEMLFKVAVF